MELVENEKPEFRINEADDVWKASDVQPDKLNKESAHYISYPTRR